MLYLSGPTILHIVCRAEQKWGMYLSCNGTVDEIFCAAPWLKKGSTSERYQGMQLASDGRGIVLFDTEEEMGEAFEATVGDSGPTKSNTYPGPGSVYALTCDPHGQIRNANT